MQPTGTERAVISRKRQVCVYKPASRTYTMIMWLWLLHMDVYRRECHPRASFIQQESPAN